MDKAQKSLVDTYLRKRKIAIEQPNVFRTYLYRDYEIAYLIINDMYDISNIQRANIVSLILHQPKVITKFDLSKLNYIEIMEILFEHHNLIDYFKPYLSKITNGDDIANVMSTLNEYDLAKYFDLSKLDSHNILSVITHNPKYIKYFDLFY